jgi:hypothetical protein
MLRRDRAGRAALAAVAATMLLLGGAGEALAASPAMAPPGNSAVNQYTESFPSADGPRQSNSLHDRRPPSAGEALGRRTARRLRARGADGRGLAALAAATAPRARAQGGGGAAATDAASPTAAVAGQALGTSSSSRSGLVLALILSVTVVWSLSYLWRRKRRAA